MYNTIRQKGSAWRVVNTNNKGNWKCFYEQELNTLGGNLIRYCNVNPCDSCLKVIKSNFINEVVTSWFNTVLVNGNQNYHQQILWKNSSIRINNRVFFWKNWYDKGIKCFGDILSENGSILSLTQFKEKFNLNVNFLNYFSLVHAIPQKWKRDVKMVDNQGSIWQYISGRAHSETFENKESL